jgi:hypothetical protein
MVTMKNILAITVTVLTMSFSITAAAEKTICDGKFANGHAVHVVIDWDKNLVKINNTSTRIYGANGTGTGIVTDNYINAFGSEVYFAIVSDHYDGDMIYQFGKFGYRLKDVLQSARLSCSKSFSNPFMKRMLSN